MFLKGFRLEVLNRSYCIHSLPRIYWAILNMATMLTTTANICGIVRRRGSRYLKFHRSSWIMWVKVKLCGWDCGAREDCLELERGDLTGYTLLCVHLQQKLFGSFSDVSEDSPLKEGWPRSWYESSLSCSGRQPSYFAGPEQCSGWLIL